MTWHRRVHHVRLFLQALFAVVVITAAVIVGLGQLALPWLVSHPEKISAFLSGRLNRPVTLDHAEGQWEHDGPALTLHDVRIASGAAAQPGLTIPQAQLKINFLALFHRNQSWNEFRLVGLDLHLVRNAAGDWRLQGLDTAADENGSDSSPLFDLGSLVLRDANFTIDDSTAGRHIALTSDEIRLINAGDHHRMLARVRSAQTATSPIDVVADYDSDTKIGRLYLGGNALDIATIMHGSAVAGWQMEHGDGRLQVWADWAHDSLMQVRTEIDLHNVVITTPQPITAKAKQTIVPHVGFDRVAFGARWKRTENGWTTDLGDILISRQGVPSGNASIHVDKIDGVDNAPATYVIDAANLDIAAPASVAMLTDALPEVWRHWLYEADPVGDVRSFALRYASMQDFDVAASFTGGAWHSVDAIPGVSSFTGSLLGDQDSFALTLPPKSPFGIDTPKVFRRPLEFSNFAGDIAIYRGDEIWRIETDALDFEGAKYGGQLRGSIDLHDDGSKPSVDAYADITHGQVEASHLFWPISTMPPNTVSFLDRAIESGRVSGRAVFHGDLADWPFRENTGRFEARADVDDVRFPYLPDWPAAERLKATVTFVNASFHIDASAAQAMGVKVDRATANLSDLGEGTFEVDASVNGTGKDLLNFLKATPLGMQHGVQLLGVSIGGTGDVNFHLQFPIKHAEQVELTGRATLADADLADAKYNLHLNAANGDVRFNQRGFIADNLVATMRDKPAKLKLAVGGFVTDPQHAVEGSLRAELPARDLLTYAPMLETYSDSIEGSAAWNVAFNADVDTVKAPSQRIDVTSDLRGVTLDLPAPLTKEAETTLPFKLHLDPPTAGGKVDLTISDILFMHGRLVSATQPFAANITFGTADATAPLPPAGLSIKGNVPQLDLSGWMDFATSDSTPGNGASGGDILAGVDVRTDAMFAYERNFGAAAFRLAPVKDALDLTFAGTNIEGALHIPTVDLRRRGVTAEFSRLFWPDAGNDAEENTVTRENPASIPPLHIRIDDFHLGQSEFGMTTVESYPVASGTHFEQVSTQSSNVEMRAHGDWLGRPGTDRSTFSIDLSARNLGHMLDAFGYAGVVDDGQTVAHMQGSWAGAPSTFALARFDGTLNVSVKGGRIPEANPGAGRIFGLFNLASLPRRMTLDFGDFFKSGFSFDSIDATFTLKDSNAFTSDLLVKGPAADIAVNGRTGLKARDYDQTMEITPHVGGTLMLGGALVGGPVGAAAGALLQGVFKNVTRNRYSVTGSWDKPNMKLLAKERIQPPRVQSKDAKPGTTLHGGQP